MAPAMAQQERRSPVSWAPPLPGHTFVLCAGSERFAAQQERWADEAAGSSGRLRLQVTL